MKKFVLRILVVLLLVVAGVLAFAATRPDTFHVERSAVIAAPPAAVYPHLADFRAWNEWSPWAKLDPAMTEEFGGTDATVGATYSWSGNSKVGQGKMTLTGLEPDTRVEIRLDFIEPFASTSDTTFTLVPEGDGTRVVWEMDGPMNYLSKVMCLFVSMDKMVGGDFEKGLAALDRVSRSTPATAPAAEAGSEAG